MSKNIVKPRSVSFEDALRNLASRLTGRSAADLPRTQEGVVQFMAENVPSLDEMAEAVTKKVLAGLNVDKLSEAVTQEIMARMAESGSAILATTEPAEEPQDGSEEPQDGSEEVEGTSTPPAAEEPQEPAEGATEGTEKPKTTRKPKAKADK